MNGKQIRAVGVACAVYGLFATAAIAASATSNVVGVIRVETPSAGNYTIVALGQLAPQGINIQNVIANKAELNAGTVGNYAAADKIIVWTGQSYAEYGLFQPTTGQPIWVASDDRAWTNSNRTPNPANFDVQPYQSVWFKTGSGASIPLRLIGDVPSSPKVEVSVAAGLTLVAFPYPTNINLSELVIENATAANNYAAADKIIVWNGQSYAEYGLFQPSTGQPIWVASDDRAWTNQNRTPNAANVLINVGQGFFYRSNAQKSIRFGRPYSL